MVFFSFFQTLSESTHTQLKKNVYQNYRQFIDTAKEIAFLESEMYQLSHMITDQRNLLFELMQFSVSGEKVDNSDIEVGGAAIEQISPDKAENNAGKNTDNEATKSDTKNEMEEGRKRLHELLEKVEGCSHVGDVPSRYLMHDGDLVEMDITENTALHRVHGYLVNDGFMVSFLLPP